MFIKKKSWIQNTAPYYASSGGGGGSVFTFQGSRFISGVPTTTVVTYAVTTGSVAAGALVVIGVGVTNLAGATIVSAIYDPTGANITLTQDAFNNANSVTAVYSGVVSGAISSGSKNIVVTYSTSAQFQDAGLYLWTINGLSSNLKQTSGQGSLNCTISATSGYYMVGASVENSGTSTYVTSTEIPTTIRSTSSEIYGPEWNTIISTNASFSVVPNAVNGGDVTVATYH